MNGRILGIKIGNTFVPCEMSCDISIDGERIATSSKENGNWRNSIAGYRSWKASVNGKFELNSAEASEAGSLGLIQAIIDGVNVELVMTLRIDSTQSLLIGGIAGTTNISISGASTGDATWSGAFDGVGLLDLDYNLEGGFLRNGDGERIVDEAGRGIVVNSGVDFYYPQDASKVSPTGTKILVADVNDEIAWIDPSDISENSFTTVEKNKLASMTAIFTTALKTAYDGAVTWISTNGANLIAHLARTDNPHSVTKAQVGLGNNDNTSDANKPVSTAQQTALNLKANLASPTFTGTPVIPSNTQPLSVLSQSGATTDQVPKWNGSAWVPYTPVGGGTTILSGTTSANDTDVNTNKYKDVTVTGAAVGGVVIVDNPFRRVGTGASNGYILTGVVTATNTVRLYFTAGQTSNNTNTQIPVENLPWAVNFRVIP